MNTLPDIDLVSLIEKDLGQGHKSGRWMLFHCPFPGHKRGDRKASLAVTNGDSSRGSWWKCFACDHHGGAIKWLMDYRGISYPDALNVLNIPQADTPSRHAFEPPIQFPDTPPAEIWQARALQLIARAETALWDERGKDALAWIQARGLNEHTIRAARLGYLPTDFQDKSEAWGAPNDDPKPIKLYEGILIPGLIASKVWYLKMRPAHRHGNLPKYLCVRGSKAAALYRADHIASERPAVFCEGELDALLLQQEIKNLASVITLASASNELNLATWGLYLLRPSCFVIAYDMDEAGSNGAAKLAWLHDARRLNIPALSDGDKDLTDFHKNGGDLCSLIESALNLECDESPIFNIAADTPDTKADTAAHSITIRWEKGSNFPTIHGKWKRLPDGRIEATYTRDEFEQCRKTFETLQEIRTGKHAPIPYGRTH